MDDTNTDADLPPLSWLLAILAGIVCYLIAEALGLTREGM
jgi:hypothetical protein